MAWKAAAFIALIFAIATTVAFGTNFFAGLISGAFIAFFLWLLMVGIGMDM